MSSLIEQAAQRLEQLRQAGVTVPEVDAAPAPAAPPAALPPAREPVATSRRVELDLDQLAAAGIVTPSAPRSTVADQFRVIKRPLIANAVGKGATTLTHGNLIMVTSAVAGEGKSFTSVNLAMSIAAELDHTVVLVDADVARPSMLRMLGLPPSAGLLDVLEGKAELADVLMRTNVDKLTLLPSGTPHPKATELLASDAMATLLDEMATRYPDRIVIFDSPPLLLTTESRVLASHMGQIVVVVAAGRTQQSAVQQALDTIDACPVRLLVLNKARSDSVGYGTQGYGYGYGYGHGEPYERSDGNTTEPAAPAAGRTEG
ncbi:chromosome partitioning ATPase [Rubrivivax gelatinosus]|uniref:XrtA-associated tyrosine autokinase n=1 Tax=Rubrivivax gelatinosus TaxID=28068 RepID=UPI00190732E6|nr:XrtA-associated tyrosine autokinase [Rubrivivax gelatinosus]MBK1612253.1 chromosome partitioning ATPase [Rubrivivax gelatinosus]